MIKAAYSSLCAAIVVAIVSTANAQLPPTETAVNEAVRRQADTIVLRQRLIEAREAAAKGDLAVAAKLYEDAYSLVHRIGTGVDAEAAQTVAGLTSVRMELARSAERHKDYKEADVQLTRALRVNPGNEQVVEMKKANDKLLAEQAGHIPDDETKAMVPGIITNKIDAATLVQDGKLLYELGKLPEAEAKLKQAIKIDPLNEPAQYYLDLVRDAKYRSLARKRETYSRNAQVKVEEAWEAPVLRDKLPVPNPYARSTAIHTGKGRQNIMSKLDRIHMDTVFYDGLPLGEVIRLLNEESKKRDPDKVGINFLINPNEPGSATTAAPTATSFDPITGLPISAPPVEQEPTDISGILIKINPPLVDLRLADVLDAIVKVAEQPIKYSIEDYAVVFSLRGPEPERLYTRTYKVDPNTFWQGLESVGGFTFGNIDVGSQGGGGRGGGRSSSRGGQGGDQSDTISIPRVNVGGAISGNRGGQQAGNQSGVGLKFLTRSNTVEEVQNAVRQFFITMGVDLVPPKTVFFNDRSGILWARATAEELDIIESAVQVLNVAPPEVNIKAKFADIGQRDQKAIGFDWYLGNVLMGNSGQVVGSGGTQPSLGGSPSAGNPQGFFPGTALENTIPSSPTDQLITSGLGNPLGAPAVATFTGILTDPQFRVVIRALDQRDGVDLLSAPEVTTISGRQAQVQIIDIQSIVTGIDLNQTATGGSAVGGVQQNTGGGAVASTLNYNVQALPFGPVLDVIPYVAADGYTIQMVIIPTVTEFIGYDNPGQFVPQAQSVSGGAGGTGIPLTGQLPLPHFRLRQVTTSAVVWDGQTVVLGGLIAESTQKSKDKVPVLGDLPIFGRLFRSESSDSQKRNLVIFVTPTIIDPAGNRFHSEEEMPFAQTSIPEQRPIGSPGNN